MLIKPPHEGVGGVNVGRQVDILVFVQLGFLGHPNERAMPVGQGVEIDLLGRVAFGAPRHEDAASSLKLIQIGFRPGLLCESLLDGRRHLFGNQLYFQL